MGWLRLSLADAETEKTPNDSVSLSIVSLLILWGSGTIDPELEPHQCLFASMWIRTGQLPCWPSRSQQVSHQRWIWGLSRIFIVPPVNIVMIRHILVTALCDLNSLISSTVDNENFSWTNSTSDLTGNCALSFRFVLCECTFTLLPFWTFEVIFTQSSDIFKKVLMRIDKRVLELHLNSDLINLQIWCICKAMKTHTRHALGKCFLKINSISLSPFVALYLKASTGTLIYFKSLLYVLMDVMWQ